MRWGSYPGGFIIQGERDEKYNIQREKSNNKEFVWDVIGAQKTFSVPDLACGFFTMPCLFFDLIYQDPSDGLHIHRTPACNLISKCPEN